MANSDTMQRLSGTKVTNMEIDLSSCVHVSVWSCRVRVLSLEPLARGLSRTYLFFLFSLSSNLVINALRP